MSGRITGPRGAELMALLQRLTAFKVTNWLTSSDDAGQTPNREVASLDDADVVSSLRPDGRHTVVLDIDHDAWLVRSTTPGHFHLYIDVPGGIEWPTYSTLLTTLSNAGVIEHGFMNASIARGHSDVRAPWVKKPSTQGAQA